MRIAKISSLDYETNCENIGILFERSDGDSRIGLPSQANTTSVSNFTNYGIDEKWTPIKNLKFGEIARASSGPCELDIFCEMIASRNIRSMELFQSYSSFQEPDFNKSCDSGRYIVKPQKDSPILSSGIKLDKFLKVFLCYPDGFSINPESDVNVEVRTKGKNEIYEASLGVEVYVGQSGQPALKNQFLQTLRVKAMKRRSS